MTAPDPQTAAPATISFETGEAAPAAAPAAPAETAQTEKDWKAEAEKWQALSRKNEDQAKANAAAAKRVRELEERDMSEAQKAQKVADETAAELARYKAEAEQLRASDLRKQVALDKGVPAALVNRLQGATADELAADADALLALMVAPRSPQPDQAQGPRPSTPQTDEDRLWEQYSPHVLPNIRKK
jgi:hypothetical protein